MVFTSITLAIGQISYTRTLGRISVKTIGIFLLCSFFALVLACGVGILCYDMGMFSAQVEGLTGAAGSTGSNPLNVVLNVVPNNIGAAFSSNTAVLAVVFLAVSLGLCMNAMPAEKTSTLKKIITEINDVVVVFLNYVVTKFGPFAIFVLLTRTFASYGINYLRPALAYVVVTVVLLLLFLLVVVHILIEDRIRWYHWMLLIVCSVVISHTRNNGIYVLVLFCGTLVLAYRKYWKLCIPILLSLFLFLK